VLTLNFAAAAAVRTFVLLLLLGLGRFILYPGTAHGFAVRGSRADPAVAAARRDALQQGLAFFRQHLVGGQPAAAQTHADPATAVGVVL
jgi:hypothetical protein